jgi:type III restriction enzyme
MMLPLLTFQEERTAELLAEFHSARVELMSRGKHQVVGLSAPTGSGKTLMTTAFIEQLLYGERFGTLGDSQEDVAGDESFTFLWLTDQPELNEQTRTKMRETAGGLGDANQITLDETFDEEAFAEGTVYFLNTQKLTRSKDSRYVWHGDKRTHTLWETLANTVERRGDRFVLVIDEAHRGMTEEDPQVATSIVQKFIKGSEEATDLDDDTVTVVVPPVPLIVGISATITRFEELIGRTTRTRRTVDVTVDEVRESGLVKDVTELKHADGTEHTDVTLLVAAIEEWKTFQRDWAAYANTATDESDLTLDPVLLVQVRDGTTNTVTRSDLGVILKTLRERLPDATDDWFAHAFQEGHAIEQDGRTLRYLKPSAIDGDPDVRVVLFKTSLNTGWDCPRAEVMVSFRKVEDATLIAQLVGRMVRARLARRIIGNDFLNTVSLYLPHFDDAGLDAVVDKLNGNEDTRTATSARRSGEIVYLKRATGVYERCFAVAENLPTYTLPPRRAMKPITRVFTLASLLTEAEREDSPTEDAKTVLIAALTAEYARLANEADFRTALDTATTVVVKTRSHMYGATVAAASRVTDTVELDASNLDAMYRDAERSMGHEGLNVAYLAARRGAGQTDDTRTKVEFVLLARRADVRHATDQAAHKQTKTWVRKHRAYFARSSTPEALRTRFEQIQGSGAQPEKTTPRLRVDKVEWARSTKQNWDKHLFVDDNGEFWEDFAKSSWERLVVATELERDDIVGWLRNTDRKPWSLRAVYRVGTEWMSVYPDFIFFREVDGEIVADILDPHMLTAKNTPERARGLAYYASENWRAYSRIELIVVDRKGKHDVVRRLDLMDEDVRRAVAAVTSTDQLARLFAV